MQRRIQVQWTEPAVERLGKVPPKMRRMILNKTAALATCEDPRRIHKKLTGPLHGYYSIKTSRYRTLYCVKEQKLADGDEILLVRVVVVLVGQRKDGDRRDVYALAERLIRMAELDLDQARNQDEDTV